MASFIKLILLSCLVAIFINQGYGAPISAEAEQQQQPSEVQPVSTFQRIFRSPYRNSFRRGSKKESPESKSSESFQSSESESSESSESSEESSEEARDRRRKKNKGKKGGKKNGRGSSKKSKKNRKNVTKQPKLGRDVLWT